MSIFSIFKRGLSKSAVKISRAFERVFAGIKGHDAQAFADLEALLISADFGVPAARKVTGKIKDRYELGQLKTDADLTGATRQAVVEIFHQGSRTLDLPKGKLTVILMVGVNGSGKTTTIGKLAARWKQQGYAVMLAACDTFRAAAAEQLRLWSQRVQVDIVASRTGADPAAVAFDATKSALAKNMDILLIDTAGRQQNQANLMAELAKIRRCVDKVYPGAPQEVWLTVDASLGSNVLSQAREFGHSTGLTGLVLTKLDGTGRGGMAVALHEEFNLPTYFVGLGEQPEDLQEFNAEYYAQALLSGDKYGE